MGIVRVISLGGSIIVPNGELDTTYLKRFDRFIRARVARGERVVVVTGGGGVARAYQRAARQLTDLTRDDLDWLGIHATRLNAHVLRTMWRDIARPVICKDPSRFVVSSKYPVAVAAGWKPGWSTDYVATRIAKRVRAPMVVNLSNIDYVYDADPRVNAHARRLTEVSWKAYRQLVGARWDPGLNAPFDPVAARLAHHSGIEVVVLNGHRLNNVGALLDGRPFIGTRIS